MPINTQQVWMHDLVTMLTQSPDNRFDYRREFWLTAINDPNAEKIYQWIEVESYYDGAPVLNIDVANGTDVIPAVVSLAGGSTVGDQLTVEGTTNNGPFSHTLICERTQAAYDTLFEFAPGFNTPLIEAYAVGEFGDPNATMEIKGLGSTTTVTVTNVSVIPVASPTINVDSVP